MLAFELSKFGIKKKIELQVFVWKQQIHNTFLYKHSLGQKLRSCILWTKIQRKNKHNGALVLQFGQAKRVLTFGTEMEESYNEADMFACATTLGHHHWGIHHYYFNLQLMISSRNMSSQRWITASSKGKLEIWQLKVKRSSQHA